MAVNQETIRAQIPQRGSKYSDEQRIEAATLYAVKGLNSIVSRELGIPEATLSGWRKEEWWDSIVEDVRSQNQDEHIARYHELTRESLSLALDGLSSLKGKDLTASDVKSLVVTGATATDKARLLENKPTSIRADSSSIQSLADQFAQLSAQWQEKQANVVSTQSGESEQIEGEAGD